MIDRMNNEFGLFIRQARIKMKQSLRSFCKDTHYDLAYISRLENGILLPPMEHKKLEAIASAYGIKEGESNWETFFNLAAASQKTIPADLLAKNPDVVNILPAFLRTASKKNITQDDVEKLLKLMKGEEDK